MTTTTDTDEATGRWLVTGMNLREFRNSLGLSTVAMANMMHVNPVTYRAWEARPIRLWKQKAEWVGRFYRSATQQIQILSEAGVTLSALVPFHEVAMMRGLTQEGLMHQYREGLVEAEDLGVLGLWMRREQV